MTENNAGMTGYSDLDAEQETNMSENTTPVAPAPIDLDSIAFSKNDLAFARNYGIEKGLIAAKRKGKTPSDVLVAWHLAGRPLTEAKKEFKLSSISDKHEFSAHCKSFGLETTEANYLDWEAMGKTLPVGYWAKDTLARVHYVTEDGTEAYADVSEERLQITRLEMSGTTKGRPVSAHYIIAAQLNENQRPVSMTTANGAQHTIREATEDDKPADIAIGFVVSWESKRDSNDLLHAQIVDLHSSMFTALVERDSALAELADMRAALEAMTLERDALVTAASEHECKPAPAKRAAATKRPARKATSATSKTANDDNVIDLDI